MKNTLTTIVNLFKADVSELESIATYYTDLLSDMERLDSKPERVDDKTTNTKEITMFNSRIEKDTL